MLGSGWRLCVDNRNNAKIADPFESSSQTERRGRGQSCSERIAVTRQQIDQLQQEKTVNTGKENNGQQAYSPGDKDDDGVEHRYLPTSKPPPTWSILTLLKSIRQSTSNMCFQIIPLCPGCEEPSGLGEEVIYADAICSGRCTGDDVVGTTTRSMTRYEVDHCYDHRNNDSSSSQGGGGGGRAFECLTPGCDGHAPEGRLSPDQEEQEVQGARDHAKVFMREKYEKCLGLGLCILPFVEVPMGPVLSIQVRRPIFLPMFLDSSFLTRVAMA